MIPLLSHFEKLENICFWVTTDNKVGTGFEIAPCDLETQDAETYRTNLLKFLRGLDPSVLSRVVVKCKSGEMTSHQLPRSKQVEAVGFSERRFLFYIESSRTVNPISRLKAIFYKEEFDSQGDMKALLRVRDSLTQNGLTVTPIEEKDLDGLFHKEPEDWIKSSASIETGSESYGVIRLVKPSQNPINEETLQSVIATLDLPFEIAVSVRSIDEATGKVFLERRLKQTASGKDVISNVQRDFTQEILIESFKSGAKLFRFEFLVILRRSSPSELAIALKGAVSKLNRFGDFKVETFGCAPSFLATLAGSEQHVCLIEIESVLPILLPLWTKGESGMQSLSYPLRSLSLLRQDRTLFHFDLFNPSYSVFNSLIVGTSGKGKSVLMGLLTRSLLNDENVNVMKVDVGGSHSKECELLHGKEFVLKLDEPSGINPLEIINHPSASDADKVGIISRFISVLIQEQGETHFSKQMRSEIETSVQNYADSEPNSASLEDFYNHAVHLPRRQLLARWVPGGLYANAFASGKNQSTTGENTRLRYYNFSQVFQAADPEFAQAAIAAVLVRFNTEMLSKSSKRLVLICDETPFFIKTCFDFFKFSTANVRKFGHAVILSAQMSTDFVVGGDSGIIANSPQRFLFSIDGSTDDYKSRFSLSPSQIASIKSLRAVPGEFSEVLLQTGDEARKLSVEITKEEYWNLTTSQTDRVKMQNLLDAVPGLNLEQAIKCLSV